MTQALAAECLTWPPLPRRPGYLFFSARLVAVATRRAVSYLSNSVCYAVRRDTPARPTSPEINSNTGVGNGTGVMSCTTATKS